MVAHLQVLVLSGKLVELPLRTYLLPGLHCDYSLLLKLDLDSNKKTLLDTCRHSCWRQSEDPPIPMLDPRQILSADP